MSPLAKTIGVSLTALGVEAAIWMTFLATGAATEKCNNGWDSLLCSEALAPILAVVGVAVAFFAFLACCAFWGARPDDVTSADRPRQ
jgi:hypothetical protein